MMHEMFAIIFREGYFTREICKNIIPRKLPPIRYMLTVYMYNNRTHHLITCDPLSETKCKMSIEYSESIIESIWPTSIDCQ